MWRLKFRREACQWKNAKTRNSLILETNATTEIFILYGHYNTLEELLGQLDQHILDE